MRLIPLLLTALLIASPAWAQQGTSSTPGSTTGEQEPQFNLPVSLDRIKEGLEQTPRLTIKIEDEKPTFRVEILERQRIEELLATLNYKAGPTPAGGVYWDEVRRQMWPSVDNPLQQPYAAYGPGELLTILIENLVGQYLGGKAVNAVGSAVRAKAEADARHEVVQAIREYCAAQPNGGAGIQICSTSSAIR